MKKKLLIILGCIFVIFQSSTSVDNERENELIKCSSQKPIRLFYKPTEKPNLYRYSFSNKVSMDTPNGAVNVNVDLNAMISQDIKSMPDKMIKHILSFDSISIKIRNDMSGERIPNLDFLKSKEFLVNSSIYGSKIELVNADSYPYTPNAAFIDQHFTNIIVGLPDEDSGLNSSWEFVNEFVFPKNEGTYKMVKKNNYRIIDSIFFQNKNCIKIRNDFEQNISAILKANGLEILTEIEGSGTEEIIFSPESGSVVKIQGQIDKKTNTYVGNRSSQGSSKESYSLEAVINH